MVTIPAQFNGPPGSGNGGWVSGLVAAAALEHGTPGPVAVRLQVPPPLDVPLSWEHDGDTTRLLTHGGAVVATAAPGSFRHDPLPAPSAEEVSRGHDAYPGFDQHPFGTCFTCGPDRAEGDGLRIFSGPVGDGHRTAAPWHALEAFATDGTIGTPITWAALDCPGGWAADFTEQPMVLGTMTAEVFSAPEPGGTYAATGDLIEQSGRKFTTATALYAEDGALVGRAEQVWIQIDPASFNA